MPADPVLLRLTAEVDRAVAKLRAYVEGAPAEAADDLVSLKDAEAEFRISNNTARRWAKVKNLGVERDGRLYLRRSLVKEHGLA